MTIPIDLRHFIAARMRGPGKYIICTMETINFARSLASPGDTLSVHPRSGDGPPTLYEVTAEGLQQLFMVGDDV